MTRLRILATTCVLLIPSMVQAQATLDDLLRAHAKTAGKTATNSIDLVTWSEYNRAGWRAIGKGLYDTAEHEFAAAIKSAQRSHDKDQRLVARSYADYAWAIQKQGRNAEAEPLIKWALTVREALLEPNSSAITQSQNQLATLYIDLGRHSEAEPLLLKAIESQSKAARPHAQELTRSHTLMGLSLVSQRRYAESEACFLKAVKIAEKALGANHPDLADSLGNLAWAYHDQGKDDQAQPLFERALKIFERSSGLSSRSLAHTLDGMAQIHAARGDHDEAEAKYLRAIEIWDLIEPSGNTSLLEVLRHYADFLEKTGRSDDLGKVKSRIAPLRARLSVIEGKTGPWYRFPDPSPGVDQMMRQSSVPLIQGS